MSLKRHIPNLFTLGNLFCGTLATIYAIAGNYKVTAFLVVLGIVFDFFDGFLARILGVSGELGKQLDSLADMVTSGVVPGVVMFSLLNNNSFLMDQLLSPVLDINVYNKDATSIDHYLSYVGFILTLAACYRLAKFNIDTRQSDSFIGLPTPAMSLFVVSLPLIQTHSDIQLFSDFVNNSYVLVGITLLLSILMNVELPLFSLKFKSFGIKENIIKYAFLIASLLMITILHYLAVPLIIILYVLLSLVYNHKVVKKG